MSLEQIRRRLEEATSGPWYWDERFEPDNDGDAGLALTNAEGTEIVGAYNYHCCSFRDDPTVGDADAEFIANARTDVARLLNALQAIQEFAVIAEELCGMNRSPRNLASVPVVQIRNAIAAALEPPA